jgi:hypothetical protein
MRAQKTCLALDDECRLSREHVKSTPSMHASHPNRRQYVNDFFDPRACLPPPARKRHSTFANECSFSIHYLVMAMRSISELAVNEVSHSTLPTALLRHQQLISLTLSHVCATITIPTGTTSTDLALIARLLPSSATPTFFDTITQPHGSVALEEGQARHT